MHSIRRNSIIVGRKNNRKSKQEFFCSFFYVNQGQMLTMFINSIYSMLWAERQIVQARSNFECVLLPPVFRVISILRIRYYEWIRTCWSRRRQFWGTNSFTRCFIIRSFDWCSYNRFLHASHYMSNKEWIQCPLLLHPYSVSFFFFE
jgi:hypothetical protein